MQNTSKNLDVENNIVTQDETESNPAEKNPKPVSSPPAPPFSFPPFSFLAEIDSNKDGSLSDEEILNYYNSLSSKQQKAFKEEMLFTLYWVLNSIPKLFEKLISMKGASYFDYTVLRLLHEAAAKHALDPQNNPDGVTQSSIVETVRLSGSAVSALLDKMDEGRKEVDSSVKGWITRKENLLNRREKIICITPEGKKQFRIMDKDHSKTKNILISDIGLCPFASLCNSIVKIASHLEGL